MICRKYSIISIIDFLAQLSPDEQHQHNSPWNIAAEFNIDMSCPHAFIRRRNGVQQVEVDSKTIIEAVV